MDALTAIGALLGGMGALAWVGNTIVGTYRARSTNRKEYAEADSIGVSTLRDVIEELTAANQRLSLRVALVEQENRELHAQIVQLRAEVIAAGLHAGPRPDVTGTPI